MPYKEPRKVPADVGTRSRTKQADARTTDVNVMVANYRRTGQIAINPKEPRYGDFSAAVTLESAFQAVKDAEAEFMKLPAKVRALAGNNPVTLLEMLADEGATAALIEAGLPVKKPATEDTGTTTETANETGGNATP